MAAATIPMAVATARLAVLPFRSHTNFIRNAEAVSRWRAPASCSSSLSCAFTAFSVVKRNAGLLARDAEVGNGEVATEEVAAPAAEALSSGEELRQGTEEARQETEDARQGTEEVGQGTVDARQGTEEARQGTEEVRQGAEEARQGSEEVRKGTEEVRQGAEEVGVVEEQVQQGTKLYIGNLPWSCDSHQLAEILLEIGAVETVEVIYEQETGRSRGFAFVRMATNEDARAVISALDGTDMGGRALKVDFPKQTRNNPRVFNPGQKRPGNVNKLFVGNLPWATDENALAQLFSGHGTVVESKVVYDKETGRSRGFGFVVMDTAEEVEIALKNLNETEFEGRLLRVDRVESKPLPPPSIHNLDPM